MAKIFAFQKIYPTTPLNDNGVKGEKQSPVMNPTNRTKY